MAEINSAFNVLSDPQQRAAYDLSRGSGEGNFGDWVHEEEAEQAAEKCDPLEKDWAVAVKFYPDLAGINDWLEKISHQLAFSYRAGLLERKAFENRKELARVLETEFLQSYFGSNPDIINFARQLIMDGNKAAAMVLNESILVLGSEGTASSIINKICEDFGIENRIAERLRQWKEEQARQRDDIRIEPPRKRIDRKWAWAGATAATVLFAIVIIVIWGKKKEPPAPEISGANSYQDAPDRHERKNAGAEMKSVAAARTRQADGRHEGIHLQISGDASSMPSGNARASRRKKNDARSTAPRLSDTRPYADLMNAVMASDQKGVDYFLQQGIDINEQEGGTTPLILAISMDDRNMAKYLISNGADPNRRDVMGRLPMLHAKAARQPDAAMIRLLKEAGGINPFE